MKIGKYTGTDILYKIGNKLTTAPLAWAYLRPDSEIYAQNYRPGEHRRILLTKKAIQDLNVKGEKYGASWPVSGLLRLIGAKDGVEFCEVADIEKKLKGANMKDVMSAHRGIGRQFVKGMGDAAGPDDFETAMKPFMDVQDIGLGARHKPVLITEGYMAYDYPKKDYPFRKDSFREYSNAERVVWSFYGGASTILNGTSEKPRDDMRIVVLRQPGSEYVSIYNIPESEIKPIHDFIQHESNFRVNLEFL
jgi:hypothetical protein